MKDLRLHILIVLITLIGFNSFSQNKATKGYRIDSDYIVFTFDKRDYIEATDEETKQSLDFNDFDIEKVVVAGNFNDWSRDKWEMVKVNENIYELRKKIEDFDHEFNWEFKFVINNSIWAEPSKRISNIVRAKNYDGKYLPSYNLNFYTAYPSKNGNAKFYLNGYSEAKKVIVSGSFNKWNEQLFEMIKTDYGWELSLELKPNIYKYRFIVDGKWIEDPSNPNKIPNEHNEFNSLIDIKTEVEFILDNFKNAKKIILAGSFNNWSENSYSMQKTDRGWIYKTKLSAGKHHYKFIIDGKWTLDPSNSVKEFDDHGHINSVKMVK